MQELLKKSVDYLKQLHKDSNGHRGITYIKLASELKCKESDLKSILNFLHKKNMLTIYNGVNNKHIKWKV